MNIRRWLFLAFLLLTTLPLAAIGYLGAQALRNVSAQVVTNSEQHMKKLGQDAIQQKAIDVAKQVNLYFEAHPDTTVNPAMVRADQELQAIAVQRVGITGYTALYDARGITHFHKNPKMVGQDMHALSNDLPEFWAIFSASLGGKQVGSYYMWRESDGTLREKYMECVPIGSTPYRIAATTYIDEFDAPIHETKRQAGKSIAAMDVQMAGITAFVTVIALLAAWALSSYISYPVEALIKASNLIEAGDFSSVDLRDIENRNDELGGLARVFSKMIQQVERREKNLKQEVHELQTQVKILIEIDQTRRQKQVKEIVETEYFEELQKKAKEMRRKRKK